MTHTALSLNGPAATTTGTRVPGRCFRYICNRSVWSSHDPVAELANI